MAPAIPFILAGAGLYLGARWLSRELQRQAELARAAEEKLRTKSATDDGAPRDLGPLVYDATRGVYVPRDGH